MFYGWYVVACAFLIAMCGFGFGFYGPGLYVASLHAIHGWPIGLLSSAVTAYYLAAAVWTAFIGDAIRRFGPRWVVVAGCHALVLGGAALTLVRSPWQVYVAFVGMSVGWAAMNGAAISAIVAPWFDKKRGLAISLALNGGSCGGVVVTPLLVFLIARYGFGKGMALALAAMVTVLIPAALLVLRRSPIGCPPDGAEPGSAAPAVVVVSTSWSRRGAFHDPAFLTISIAFALGFLAQVGFLTHQISYLLPLVGAHGAALVVSMTTLAAIVGRTVTGSFVDTVDRRLVACANFATQAAAIVVLLAVESRSAIYVGCVLFGLGVGNMNTLPALIVQREFPPEHFGRVVSLVVSVNHIAFALGPAILGALHDWSSDYRTSFILCMSVEIAAAVVVLLGRRRV